MTWRDVLTVQAEPDPFVVMRVSSIIAVDNTIPALLSAACRDSGEIELVIELRDLPERRVRYLASKIESSIPSVLHVSRVRKATRNGTA